MSEFRAYSLDETACSFSLPSLQWSNLLLFPTDGRTLLILPWYRKFTALTNVNHPHIPFFVRIYQKGTPWTDRGICSSHIHTFAGGFWSSAKTRSALTGHSGELPDPKTTRCTKRSSLHRTHIVLILELRRRGTWPRHSSQPSWVSCLYMFFPYCWHVQQSIKWNVINLILASFACLKG